ncbi:MAG: SAM-dependent methyltransferase, partial [Bacteroidetes bacterium]|nr:SAM-dependent methyltransferase [Bacteroidota bacterium]
SVIETLSEQNIGFSKTDWDSRETSWDFQKSPLLNEALSLKQAYQRWEAAATQDFFQLHANEEELNRIFIDIYGLQEELTPEVPLKDITILQEELDRSALEQDEVGLREWGIGIRAKDEGLPLVPEGYRLPISKAEVMSQFVSYAIGVLLGRYRLATPGLHIAHPNATEEELTSYTYQSYKITIDEDAILPLLGDEGAFPDDALLRTKDMILAIWGEDTLTENLNFLHEGLGMNLHKWLTEKFWGYHTSMYKKKPIYWLFCSNPKKPHQAAFRVLVYMHRMDKYTVGKIQRQYLHPHQEYIRHDIQRLADQENTLGKSELKRLETLRSHQIECRDYNEVLKELSLREIEFDLDDGVDVNYAKFEGAVAKI